MRRRRHGELGEHGEHGALTPAVLILAIMVFWLAGLVIDGARQLNARSRAIAYAQEAARAGASGIDLNIQDVTFDPKEVRTRVDKYCTAAKSRDKTLTQCGLSKEPNAEELSVSVELKNPTTFLAMLGIKDLTAKAEVPQEAHAEQGINKADETPEVPTISVLPTSQDPGEDPKPSASDPTLDPPCVPTTTITTTITVTETLPFPTPPDTPTTTITPPATITTSTPGPLPTACTPRGP